MAAVEVYWQTWSSRWCSKPEDMDLVRELDPRIKTVYLAFSTATHSYSRGRKSLDSTGLQFSQDFSVVVGAIAILKARGVRVMLSVGGGSYPFSIDTVKPACCVALAQDLGADGIDVDWEPANPATDAWQFGPIISAFRKEIWPGARLSAAVWSIGAEDPAAGGYSGMNRAGLRSNGRDLDWINIMAYDAGKSYDPIKACRKYREVYAGPMHLGFEIGKQGWGDALLSLDDVIRGVAWISQESPDNRVFVWAYQKENYGTPGVKDILEIAAVGDMKPPPPEEKKKGLNVGKCLACGKDVYLGVVPG